MNIGQKIFRYESVTSTNEVLKDLAQDGFEPGTVVVGGIQIRGRGRLERSWESPKGGLWLSVLLDASPSFHEDKFGIIPLMTACAVAHAIASATTLAVRVKWPNDVLINERKTCGILGELLKVNNSQLAVVGIGINVNNPVRAGYEFSPVSTSLYEELGKEVNLEELERVLLTELDCRVTLLAEKKFDAILEEWRSLSDTLGRKVRITTQTGEIEGLAKDIDENGSLIIETDDKTITILAGDCAHLE
jgi:BirA family biotin operon repressor/biotin-[acetyl-CoA-carboxylase] ligase